MRSRNCPPKWRARTNEKSAVRAPPTWRKPVGEGAKRVTTLLAMEAAHYQEAKGGGKRETTLRWRLRNDGLGPEAQIDLNRRTVKGVGEAADAQDIAMRDEHQEEDYHAADQPRN